MSDILAHSDRSECVKREGHTQTVSAVGDDTAVWGCHREARDSS